MVDTNTRVMVRIPDAPLPVRATVTASIGELVVVRLVSGREYTVVRNMITYIFEK